MALPQTYMNLSGQAVKRMLSYTATPLERLVVVHDDLDLEPGRIRLRLGGGSGGHRGVQSVIDSLQSPEFIRLKIGIGRPETGGDAEKYVLGRFTAAEKPLLEDAFCRGEAALRTFFHEGLAKAMSLHNRP
jgi:PTH1 family peptidyl-tRNA hydrolase